MAGGLVASLNPLMQGCIALAFVHVSLLSRRHVMLMREIQQVPVEPVGPVTFMFSRLLQDLSSENFES